MSEHEALMWNIEKDPWLNPSGARSSCSTSPSTWSASASSCAPASPGRRASTSVWCPASSAVDTGMGSRCRVRPRRPRPRDHAAGTGHDAPAARPGRPALPGTARSHASALAFRRDQRDRGRPGRDLDDHPPFGRRRHRPAPHGRAVPADQPRRPPPAESISTPSSPTPWPAPTQGSAATRDERGVGIGRPAAHLARRQSGIGRRLVGEMALWPADPSRISERVGDVVDTVHRRRPAGRERRGRGPRGHRSGGRSRHRHLEQVEAPLDGLKAARALGGSINDGFMAGLTEAAARYHQERGVHVDT